VELHALAQGNGVDKAVFAGGGEVSGQIREEGVIRVIGVEPVEEETTGTPPVLAPLGATRVQAADITGAEQAIRPAPS
jgi:hypothetical protein